MTSSLKNVLLNIGQRSHLPFHLCTFQQHLEVVRGLSTGPLLLSLHTSLQILPPKSLHGAAPATFHYSPLDFNSSAPAAKSSENLLTSHVSFPRGGTEAFSAPVTSGPH